MPGPPIPIPPMPPIPPLPHPLNIPRPLPKKGGGGGAFPVGSSLSSFLSCFSCLHLLLCSAFSCILWILLNSLWGQITSGLLILLLLLLLLLPAPAPLLGLLLHLVDPLEQSLGPDHLRAADPHHVVARMLPSLLAGSAQVVVIADDTLVTETNDRGLVASIARDSMVGHICSNSRLLRLFHLLSGAHSCRELVHGTWQLGESQDELLVRVDGY